MSVDLQPLQGTGTGFFGSLITLVQAWTPQIAILSIIAAAIMVLFSQMGDRNPGLMWKAFGGMVTVLAVLLIINIAPSLVASVYQ